jgi:enoyl-CoA hydratase
MNLALGCDLRVVGPSARFESRFLDIALHPGGGHTWLTHRLLGPEGAAAAVLFGQRIGAEEAVARRLAWKHVDSDDAAVVDEAVAIAERAAEAPRELVTRIKASLRAAALASTQDDALDLEIDHQLWSAQQPEFGERLAALADRISKKT